MKLENKNGRLDLAIFDHKIACDKLCLTIKERFLSTKNQDVEGPMLNTQIHSVSSMATLNMILGQMFSGLIPIRPLKIGLATPKLSMRARYCKPRSEI